MMARSSGPAKTRPRTGRQLRVLAAWLAVVGIALPLIACSAVKKEDDYVPESPADLLYNEGLRQLSGRAI
jgi:outer membrane protein assembly factor BamD (BamD/ComL family)